jgi:hypothetical protein
MRGRDSRDPNRRHIQGPSGGSATRSDRRSEEDEAISRLKTEELDRLVAAGTIREIDREHVRFIVRRIVSLLSGPMIPCPRT